MFLDPATLLMLEPLLSNFLIDPTNKIVMYNDRKPATIDKEFFNQKSFSDECFDLGVDEPIASYLFPAFRLGFDQINSHDGAMHIKKELENGQVLLEMNYNHTFTTMMVAANLKLISNYFF